MNRYDFQNTIYVTCGYMSDPSIFYPIMPFSTWVCWIQCSKNLPSLSSCRGSELKIDGNEFRYPLEAEFGALKL